MLIIKPFFRTGIAIFLLSFFMPTIGLQNWMTLILAAVVLTILYQLIRPLLKLLFLPINIVTLGLFSTVINVGLLWLATYLVPGFVIEPMVFFGISLNLFFSLLLVSIFIGFLQGLVGIIL